MSKILKTIHKSVSRMHSLGITDTQTMKEFDKLCFKDIKVLNPEDIKHFREKERVSQSILARYLNMLYVTTTR